MSARVSEENKHVNEKPFSPDQEIGVVTSTTIGEINARTAHDDNELLAEIGYKPELRRHFSTIQVFGVAFSIMGLLPSIASTLSLGLNAGPVGMVWGWFCSSFFILCIGISMAELGSSIPTSGGLYYWTYYFAPESIQKSLSFVIGYSNSLGLISGLCSIDYGLASLVLSAVRISNPDFEATNGKLYGIFVACVVLHVVVTSIASGFVSRLQTTSIIANLGLILLFIIALPAGTEHRNDGAFIFGQLDNATSWNSGWNFMLSWMPAIWTIGSFDSCVHMSEEATNAAKAVPFGIITSISACWILGFVIMIVIAACMSTDLDHILNTDLGMAIAQIIYDSLGKKWTLAFMSLMIICQFLMGASILTGGSRQVWAFSRDNGLPFSFWIKKVHKTLKVPLHAIQFEAIIAILIGLLCLIGEEASSALFSLAVASNYLAWGTPVLCRMVFARKTFIPGPFYLGKVFSFIVNWITIIWIIFVIILCMFPEEKTVDKTSMNYTVVINGAVWILSLVYYFVYAHKIFNGPVKTIEDITPEEVEEEFKNKPSSTESS